ncbi:hypothetical protein [Streptomyces sp. NPDC058751]|uniref:hypothetical protein n=1 Tax=Streptomyces sp. NPDC058751 TaxID=3346623 RepID=UPI0036D1DC68
MEPHREPDARPDAGERRVGDGAAPGPRVVPAADPGDGRTPLEGLLAAAMRGRAGDGAAETRAVAAFRVARDGGAHTARTRRRDDWRPKERKGPGRSLRAAFAVLLAGLTLGGVAVAGIGPVSRDDADRGRAAARPSAGAPDRFPGATAPAAPGALAPGGPVSRPPLARDTEAHCRAYASVKDRGGALDARTWRRLVAAAGGEDEVEAFCAGRPAARTGAKGAKGAGGAENARDAEGSGGTDGAPGRGSRAASPKPAKSRGDR